jgi:hypothetical protein
MTLRESDCWHGLDARPASSGNSSRTVHVFKCELLPMTNNTLQPFTYRLSECKHWHNKPVEEAFFKDVP